MKSTMKTTIQQPIVRSGRAVMPRRGQSTIPTSPVEPASSLRLKSILVPIDFSGPSNKALRYAVPFAEQFGAKLILLHVIEPVATPDFAKSFPLSMENDKVMALCKGRLEDVIKEEAIDPRLLEKVLVRWGRSCQAITEAARTLKADLIIISTNGYTGIKHAVLGSTTERVVRHAPCPVLVVRETEHEFVNPSTRE